MKTDLVLFWNRC